MVLFCYDKHMSLIYITGIAGSGKSAVLKELNSRGYETYDADENLSSWEHKVTRKRVSASDHKLTTDPKFFEDHDWYIDKEGVSKLAKSAADKTIFLGGSVTNEDEVWPEFDKVYCLYIDNKSLEQRIKNRNDKDFGKSKHELKHLLNLNNNVQKKYTSLGAVIVDATQSVNDVVEEILANVQQ